MRRRGEYDGHGAAGELRVLRRRIDVLERRLGRKSRDVTPDNPVLIGRVYDGGNMPDSLPGFFAVHPVANGGVEAEGAEGELTPVVSTAARAAKTFFLVLGGEVPEPGDFLIARAIDGRWVAQKGGSADGCTLDLVFVYYEEFTNLNEDGEATIHANEGIGGVYDFHVVPEHITGDGHERWVLTIPGIHVPNGTYHFTTSRTGSSFEAFTKNIIGCESYTFMCMCPQVPDVLDLTVVTPDADGFLRSCELTYGLLPPEHTVFGPGPLWHSKEFTHPTITPAKYIIVLRCVDNAGNPTLVPWLWVARTFLGFPYYVWDDVDENTCDPISWTVGHTPAPGSPQVAVITG